VPILAGTPTPVIAAAEQWVPFSVFWHGCDGSRWDMTDPEAGVVLSPDGVKGLGMPTFDRYTLATPSLAGARYTGSRTQERSWLWPVFIWSPTSTAEWLERHDSFLSSMRPDVKGTFELVRPDGTSRFLDLRFVDDNGQTYGLDPALQGWSVHAFTMVADDNPYWYGPSISRTFSAPDNSSFFLTSGGVFYIGPGGTTDAAFIPNGGDVNAWPVWTATGPFNSASLGAGGGTITLPALGSGDVWVIDTNPQAMTATDQTGADQSDQVTWNPAPIPPGTEVELTLAMVSPGTGANIAATLTPRYFRAF
jgi:hypothetical protein